MSVRTVCNQTIRSTKRSVTCSANEINLMDGSTFAGENNLNLVVFDDGSGAAWFYPGYDHIPCSTTQNGTQPV